MAGSIKTNSVQLGDSATDSQNFLLKTNVDGTAKLARGAAGNLGDILTVDASGIVNTVKQMTLGTTQATTSGTSIDFTGIPSWVKRISIGFNGVSTSGTSSIRLQIGPSGGVETGGYAGSAGAIATAAAGGIQTGAAGFDFTDANSAAATRFGLITLMLMDASTNLWVVYGGYGQGNSVLVASIGGAKTLAGALSRLRLTTVNGTDTFDAGSINILYEG